MKTITIKGMMCPHCEARVKSALEASADVINATVSHKEGTAVVEAKEGVSDAALAKIVTDAGYEVVSVR